MSDVHLTFNRTILVDGKLAAECTKDSAPLFEEAYRSLFPTAKIEILTAFQLSKVKRKEKERLENANEEQEDSEL